MPSDPTRSDFARLDDRVRTVEPLADRFQRTEAKIDTLHTALAELVRFEERQANQAQRYRELVDTVNENRTLADQRAAGMAERFDARIIDIEKAHQTLASELHGYVQRYMGISAAIGGFCILLGGAWAVTSKLIHT